MILDSKVELPIKAHLDLFLWRLISEVMTMVEASRNKWYRLEAWGFDAGVGSQHFSVIWLGRVSVKDCMRI